MNGKFVLNCFSVVGLACLLLSLWSAPALSQQREDNADSLKSNAQALDLAAIAPDAYEPDNTWQTSRVIVLNDQRPHPDLPAYRPIQSHNFHMAGDEDWVKFFILKDDIYKVTVDSPEENCDVVITIYDTDGQTVIKEVDDTFSGEKEYAEWECKADGLYYARIRQYNPDIFGERTEYKLSLTQPYMTFDGFIYGFITPVMSINLTTGSHATRSHENGEYFLPHVAGSFNLEVLAERCNRISVPVIVNELEVTNLDIALDCQVQTGSLQVTLLPQQAIDEGAGWRVDKGGWQESGATVSGLSAGGHSLDFKSLSGWEMPDSRTVVVSGGATTTVSATYEWNPDDFCLDADGAKDITVSCAQYGNAKFSFMLNCYTKPQNPSALYWKMDGATFSPVNSSACVEVQGDFSMSIACVEYNGTKYECVLRYYNDTDDPHGYHWELDLSTLKVKVP